MRNFFLYLLFGTMAVLAIGAHQLISQAVSSDYDKIYVASVAEELHIDKTEIIYDSSEDLFYTPQGTYKVKFALFSSSEIESIVPIKMN